MTLKLFKKDKKNQNHRGFIVLTMILLVSAVVLIITTGITLRSIEKVNESIDTENSFKAWSVVNACGEYALWQMSTTTGGLAGWNFASTTGQELAVGTETCYIYPVTGNGTAKVIKASSTISQFTKKIVIEVATNTPSILINYWEEVADF